MTDDEYEELLVTVIALLKERGEERLIPRLLEKGKTEAEAKEIIRRLIAQLENQLYHIREARRFGEIGEQLKRESERLLREAEGLGLGLGEPGIDWKWIVAGLGILFLMGRSTKKPEASSLPE